jgi:cephalosporin-C deacetylase
MLRQRVLVLIGACMTFCSLSFAQPARQYVTVLVAPDHPDWTYKVGDDVEFKISVLQAGNPLKNVHLKYEIRPEKMADTDAGEIELVSGEKTIRGGTMQVPGFLRCWASVEVDGTVYSGYATAGFDPHEIKPTTTLPEDFMEFWDQAKAEASLIPVDAKMKLLPDRCTSSVNVYHVSIQNFKEDSRIYGMLAVPAKAGKYPALLKVPGAGVRPYEPFIELAEKGIITLKIGIHGIPVDMDPGIYNNLRRAALDHYWFYNLDNRDRYYYKRVYLGCVRAIDFIFSLPGFDGERLAVTGGSQGGALTIITAALDPRVKWLAAHYPALCDLTGYLNGRAGGWPHMFNKENADFNNKKDKIETSKYYDVVNFARFVKIPGYYSWGYNDLTCPPTSMFAAYNVITAPKELHLALDTGHWTYPQQREQTDAWLVEQLLNKTGTKR